jgi:hypothetical protein
MEVHSPDGGKVKIVAKLHESAFFSAENSKYRGYCSKLLEHHQVPANGCKRLQIDGSFLATF